MRLATLWNSQLYSQINKTLNEYFEGRIICPNNDDLLSLSTTLISLNFMPWEYFSESHKINMALIDFINTEFSSTAFSKQSFKDYYKSHKALYNLKYGLFIFRHLNTIQRWVVIMTIEVGGFLVWYKLSSEYSELGTAFNLVETWFIWLSYIIISGLVVTKLWSSEKIIRVNPNDLIEICEMNIDKVKAISKDLFVHQAVATLMQIQNSRTSFTV